MKTDEKFTKKLQEYLFTPEADRNIEAGALLLLQLNSNRILFQNIVRRPDKHRDKLFYELNKHLSIRASDTTVTQIIALEKKVAAEITPVVEEIIKITDKKNVIKFEGKRVDHEELPDAIKAIYVEQATIAHQMRDLHAKLRLKSSSDFKPCDRFQELDLLVNLHKQYRSNWEIYDHFEVGTASELIVASEEESTVQVDAKRVASNRKYLSANKAKLNTLLKAKDVEKHKTLLAECQLRYDELTAAGQTLAEKQLGELVSAGVIA